MDGAGIETYEQYFDKLWEVFGFSEIPAGWKKDFHTEDDFMTEMDELPSEKYVFVIKNYDKFLPNNNYEKMKLKITTKTIYYHFGMKRLKKLLWRENARVSTFI